MAALAKKILKRMPSNVKLTQTDHKNHSESNLQAHMGQKGHADRTSHPLIPSSSMEKHNCTLLVVGAKGVGKTALIVRFLAKRFLPQYEGGSDKSYNRAVEIENKVFNLTIVDKAGKETTETVSTLSNLDHLDGLVVVFSCDDSGSFDHTLDLLDYFKFDCKATLATPTLVVCNKTDLSHCRTVGRMEAERCVLKYPGCSYEECSAAAQDDTVEIVFRSFINQTLAKSDTRELQQNNGRKSSIGMLGSPKVIRAHFKRRFSMFGRDRTGST